MNRRCHACGEPSLAHERDQAMRGGTVEEHWRCSACETHVRVVGPITAAAGTLGALFFMGSAVGSDRFAGSAESIAIMRAGLFAFGLVILWLAPIRRWRFERQSPPASTR